MDYGDVVLTLTVIVSILGITLIFIAMRNQKIQNIKNS